LTKRRYWLKCIDLCGKYSVSTPLLANCGRRWKAGTNQTGTMGNPAFAAERKKPRFGIHGGCAAVNPGADYRDGPARKRKMSV